MCLDGHRSIPEEEKTRSQKESNDTINSINCIFQNRSENEILYMKYILKEECKVRVEENVSTQEQIKCHEDYQECSNSLCN